MILFDGMTQLDLTGPLEVFTRFPDTVVRLIAKDARPVRCDRGLMILPDTAFIDCPEQFTVLFVPGGPGVSALLKDMDYINFIRSKQESTYITSVCTGSIVLAACGLLKGYRATTHWLSLDLLNKFDVKSADERVVIDRNRITGGGVTSGIDFALMLGAILLGEQVAKEIQLMIEYNPQPPFDCGHPSLADYNLVKSVKEKRAEAQEKRRKEIDEYLSVHPDFFA